MRVELGFVVGVILAACSSPPPAHPSATESIATTPAGSPTPSREPKQPELVASAPSDLGTGSVGSGSVGGGAYDPAILRRVVRRRASSIQYCYELALLKDPSVSGVLVVEFVIEPKGHVVEASATGMTPEVQVCVVKVFESLEFPPSEYGTRMTVHYPITFAPPS